MMEDTSEFEIEMRVTEPFKRAQKEKVIKKIGEIFYENFIDAKFEDTFYVEKHGLIVLSALHVIFRTSTTVPHIAMTSFIFEITAYLKSNKGGKIKITKSDGKTISISSQMSKEEVKGELAQ